MTRSKTMFTFAGVWLVTLAVTFWIAVAATQMIAWFVVALVALIPPLMLIVLDRAPAQTVAEVIRDVESGRSV